jgi:hypothetical protein
MRDFWARQQKQNRQVAAQIKAQRAGGAPPKQRAAAAPSVPDLDAVGFTGDRLRALRQRVEPVSPLPGILDPEPHLHILNGKPKSGKTTFGLALARAWAQGVEPWTGASPLPGTRALVVSREQPVARLDATLRRLAHHAGRGNRWEDRVTILARDRELAPEGKRLLTLDGEGLAALDGALHAAERAGDPYGLVLLDSLSRLKPAAIEERDNDGMSRWLDGLEALAMARRVWLLLIHHVGHVGADGGRDEARSAGRGASAIAAVAQVVWLLERDRDPRMRRLKVDGNSVLPAEHHFQVAGQAAEPGELNYFELVDPLEAHDPAELLAAGPVSLSDLARRLSGQEPGEKPSGAALRRAGELVGRWERRGLVTVADGPRRSKVVGLNAAP